MRFKLPTLLLLLTLLAGMSTAQDRDTLAPRAIGDWRSPIHAGPDDPAGGVYGIWASGADYKASFHDGFGFYPCLGTAYPENLPLHWKTESIRAGGETFLTWGDRLEDWHSDWRYELRYPNLTEAYDVIERGVEQSFTLHQPPPRPGDLIVTGRIQTPLKAAVTGWKHAPLQFSDEAGNPVAVYGEATAFDASGRQVPVETSYDGARISLRVDGGWLERASYPVTIDPLTSRSRLVFWGSSSCGTPTAVNVAYGTSCSSGQIYADRPLAGSELFRARLGLGYSSTAAILLLGLGPGSFSLGNGSVYLQWLQVSPFGTIQTTEGLRCQIRP